MAIYKYTLIKYLKSFSTWIIIAFSVFLITVLGGWVAFLSFDPSSTKAATDYATLSVFLVAGITGFLATFTSIFSGFKAATMYKDEVEDGTFLVMLSKPISRSKLIFFKWFALLSIQVIYSFILALSFLLSILIFDKGPQINNLSVSGIPIQTLTSKIVQISCYMWLILLVMSLIFSSIAILVSTKVAVGGTIGIAIGLGVIIPMTGMIGMFTQKPAYKPISNSNVTILKDIAGQLSDQDLPPGWEKFISPEIEALLPPDWKQMIDDVNLDNIEGTPDDPTLYSVGLATGSNDAYRYAWIGDISFQVNALASIASSQAIPDAANSLINTLGSGVSFGIASSTYIEDENGINQEEFNDNMLLLDEMIANTWTASDSLRSAAEVIFGIVFADIKDFKEQIDNNLVGALYDLGIEVELQLDGKRYFDQSVMTEILQWRANNQDIDANLEAKYYNALSEFLRYYWTKSSIFIEKIGPTLDMINNFLPGLDFINFFDNLISPLSWVSSRKISIFIDDYGVSLDNSLKPANPGDSVALNMISNGLPNNLVYQALASSIEKGNTITKITTEEYANKYGILYVYLAIAFVLVPTAYFVVRRQDFR